MLVFRSHTWALSLQAAVGSLAVAAASALGGGTTYQDAVWWGAAHPDITGCWLGNRSFERCCVNWNILDELPGKACWSEADHAASYQACCVPKNDWAPRSFFSCADTGIYWERLRQTLSLFRSLTALQHSPLNGAAPQECLIGGVLVSLLELVYVSYELRNASAPRWEHAYNKVENSMRILFSSPVSLEEILVSGWPLFLTLDFFRFDNRFQELATQRLPGVFAGFQTMKYSNTLSAAIQAEQGNRIALDVVVKLANSVAKAPAESALVQLMPAFTALVNYHNLRKFDLPRSDAHDVPRLGVEAKRLIEFADTQLRSWMAHFGYTFSLLIKLEIPLVNLLQALSWPGVVMTQPAEYLKSTIHFPGLQLAKILPAHQAWHLPLVEQHIHPGFDAASNMVRTTLQPMCYAPGFLFVILATASHVREACEHSQAECRARLKVWDVGASYGDCMLWAASYLLEAFVSEHLELRGFEPLPSAAAAFRRSVRALQRSRKLSPVALRFLVEEIAMRDQAGEVEISFPSHSMALATFHRCEERYSVASNNLYHCISRPTRAETLDSYMASFPEPSLPDPVDVLKLHVQGDELSVLRGANVSLASGRVCLLHMNLETLLLQVKMEDPAHWLAEALISTLKGADLVGVLVNLWEVKPATFESIAAAIKFKNPDAVAWKPPDPNKRPEELHYELVAWRPSWPCHESVAVRAVSSMWLPDATPL